MPLCSFAAEIAVSARLRPRSWFSLFRVSQGPGSQQPKWASSRQFCRQGPGSTLLHALRQGPLLPPF